MRTLVYKRTHNGDPDEQGQFGIHDCMGTVRAREYGAVIGVGGVGPEPVKNGIAGKVTWVGIGPRKVPQDRRGPLVLFDHFLYYGEEGPLFEDHAPTLAAHIYSRNVRSTMVESDDDPEVARILALAEKAPRSAARRAQEPPPISTVCRRRPSRRSREGRPSEAPPRPDSGHCSARGRR